MSPLWSPEQERELIKLSTTLVGGAYLSHRAIGGILGKSRNAIIGKLHRLKISRDPLVSVQGVDHRVVPQQTPVREVKVSRAVLPPVHGRRGPPRPPQTPSVAPSPTEGRSPHAVSVLELTNDVCHYPIGHVGHEGFHLCGAPVGPQKPYCKTHGQLCYRPVQKRLDQRPVWR